MVSAGGYRPGLGPFHASTLEALVAHTPGIDVYMPSSAGDAAGLLNAAFESGRPSIFFYPKNQLNDRATATGGALSEHLVPPGKARFLSRGNDLTIVAYGNTVPLAIRTATTLAEHGVGSDVIDLRSIQPWDSDAVLESANRTGRVIVTHEDSRSAGFGAEIIASIAERAGRHIDFRRLTRGDTYVPCNFANQLEVLPSYRKLTECAVELLGGEITWRSTSQTDSNTFTVEAIGSSPSDEMVSIVEWSVQAGDTVEEGSLLAEIEADKAASTLKSPVAGTVRALLLEEGDAVAVGTPIAEIERQSGARAYRKPAVREEIHEALISGIPATRTPPITAPAPLQEPHATVETTCLVREVSAVVGGRAVANGEITAANAQWSDEEIVKRTGITQRYWVEEDEDALTLAVRAAAQTLKRASVGVDELDLIIFATGTPLSITPSMATLLQHALANQAGKEGQITCPAYDIIAACSGYIYGLRAAWDFLTTAPHANVLLVTSEVLSQRLDLSDTGTAPIFGDGASATLLVGPRSMHATGARARLCKPVIAAKGESGASLSVPVDRGNPIAMDGPKVYLEAVRAMIEALTQAASHEGIAANELDLYIPHQANQRIINGDPSAHANPPRAGVLQHRAVREHQ